MSPASLRSLFERHGLTQAEAARLLRVHPRTVRKWLAGDRPIPGPVSQFFRLIQITGLNAKRALKLIG